jgi:hypothetical protein
MLLSEWLRQHPDALRQVGVRALEDAKKTACPSPTWILNTETT